MRSENDRWDITGGVGATALVVAVCRADETARGDRLIDDPYAQVFLDAAGDGILPVRERAEEHAGWASLTEYAAVRSRYFDDALTAAVRAGTTQVVLLASGLDARAYRLGWPSGVTVFEVDQPGVLEFKQRALTGHGAVPDTARVAVPADLRGDWPAALRAAGFDPSRPAAWLAEALLPYLPPDAERLLIERVRELSAPGSRFAVEDLTAIAVALEGHPRLLALMNSMFDLSLTDLFFDGDRGDRPADRLRAGGWAVAADTGAALLERYGRSLDGDFLAVFGAVELLTADLGG